MRKSASTMMSIVLFAFLLTEVQGQISNPRNISYDWKTDMEKATINLEEIMGVVPRGTFPKIDYPAFIEKDEGLKRFFRHEPVIAVEVSGEAKAYPLNMLTMHEISNDNLNGLPILPTYCPLCNAGIVYDRRMQDENGNEVVLEFEVSGMLRKSDMVMYDRQTESWWQQLTGEALAGSYAGQELKVIPSLIISVAEFFERYPNGFILSPDTGTRSEERYGKNPYINYDDKRSTPYERFFKEEDIDDRLPAFERVLDVEKEKGYRIYPFSTLSEEGVINDEIDGRPIVIFHGGKTVSVLDKGDIRKSRHIGSATAFHSIVKGRKLIFFKDGEEFKDTQTGSSWDIAGLCTDGPLEGNQLVFLPHGNHFAFAWLAFHPDSEIYGDR